MHLGHAYSALFNQRLAEASGGRLILRIEDLDRTRCKPAYEAAIRDDLAWLGLRFEASPRRQSEHAADYEAALGRLDALGLVYPCFCSRAQVAREAAGRDPDRAPFYGGHCRVLSAAERRQRRAAGEKAAFRLDMAAALRLGPGRIVWDEYGEGALAAERVADPSAWGDVVLKGRGLAASYHLAVTVDDAIQGVTDIARGRDLLAATSVHRLLQELLGFSAPRYRHHRLVLDSGGGKLAKSRGSPTLASMRADGVTAIDVWRALGFAAGKPALAVVLS